MFMVRCMTVSVLLDVTKTRNGMDNGLLNRLGKLLEKHMFCNTKSDNNTNNSLNHHLQ